MSFNFTKLRTTMAVAAVSAALGTGAAAQNLSMSSLDASSGTTAFSIAFSELVQQNHPYRIQVATGEKATRMAVDAGMGELDLFLFSAPITHWMRNKQVMYKDMDAAPELASKLRTIMAYPLGAYQFVVWADSGIESFEDLKGRTVYMGPPAGAATRVTTGYVEAASGLKVDEDYTASKLDWASGLQAFQDRQVDLYVTPDNVPSGVLMQLAALGEIRILGVDEETLNSDAFAELRQIPGRRMAEIAPDAYGDNQVNTEAVHTVATWVGLGTHAGLDEEVVYNMTKTLWENIDALHETAKWMNQITLESAFTELNAPLHPGAYRYYKEIGVEVPEDLIPEGAM